MDMKRICVYCGSSMGAKSIYQEAARTLGQEMAKRKIELVYGGGDVGLMGAVARAVIEAGGYVIGIIPTSIYDKEVGNPGVNELYVVNSMHERKTMMAQLSDGFIALPGGFGTLEEYVEVLTWSQLGFHNKPCGLLNVGGYYSGLTQFFDHQVSEGFVKPNMRNLVVTADTPTAMLDLFATYQPLQTSKWLTTEDDL